jgi:murein L,D-transpeptidase YcbB/YkuD
LTYLRRDLAKTFADDWDELVYAPPGDQKIRPAPGRCKQRSRGRNMRAAVVEASLKSVSALALLLSLVSLPLRAQENRDGGGNLRAPAAIEPFHKGRSNISRTSFQPRAAALAMGPSHAASPSLAAFSPAKSLASPIRDLEDGDIPQEDAAPATRTDSLEKSDPTGSLPPNPPTLDTNVEKDDPAAPSLSTLPEQAPNGTAAANVLPSLNAAVKAALEARWAREAQAPIAGGRRREHEAIAAFYTARDFAPLWSSDGEMRVEVQSVIARLERAADDGLGLKNAQLPSALTGGAEEIAAADIALSDAVVAYGRQASGARVDPHVISPLIGESPDIADSAIILATVANAGEDAGAALRAFNPPQKAYAALRDKLAELRRERGPAARSLIIPTGPTLKVGMRDPRVPLIRARLSLDGQASAASENLIYDTRVAMAVADFQKANGLPVSGMLTARTIAVLSGGQPSRLEAEILANMERWRWMPRDMGERRIEVNIPDYEVVVMENDQVVQRNRVVVGKEQTPTPIFSNKMQFLIVNPSWNVPQSIIRKEMLPKLAADPDYLRRLGYQVAYSGGRLTVRQPPGERNALGRIKFMFPNDYAVYMHDTPLRALFGQSRRAFSHGCVRVDDPFRFAQTLLGHGWSEQRVKGLIGGKERYVYLPKPLQVHLEYFTTFVDESGRLQLRDDIYGYSHRVKAALGLEG